MFESADERLLASTVGGVCLVVATALAGDAVGLTGTAAFAAPLLVGVAVAVGIVARR